MDRRDFLAAVSLMIAAWSDEAGREDPAAPTASKDTAQAKGQTAGQTAGRRFKRWLYGCGSDPERNARELKAAGLDAVVGVPADAVNKITEAGLEAWLCGGAFGTAETDAANLARDLDGQARYWFGSGSPNSPVLRDRCLKNYENMAATPGITGIFVDGCRFASPASGWDALFTDFSEHSRSRAEQLGMDWEVMVRDMRVLRDLLREASAGPPPEALRMPLRAVETLARLPGVVLWLRFRRACINEQFRAIDRVIHGAGLRMGVYVFTPALAPLVGQDYAVLMELADVVSPMLYRNYAEAPGIACLNWELAALAAPWGGPGDASAGEQWLEAAVDLLNWSEVVSERDPGRVREALPPALVGLETARARQVPGRAELAPIINIADPAMAETVAAVRQAGADGVGWYLFRDDWKQWLDGVS